MQNWKKVFGAATLCVTLLGPLPVSALEARLPVLTPVGEEATSGLGEQKEAVHTIVGLLTWVDLEGGFYSVDGYRLIGDEAIISPFVNQEVLVTGTISDEVSIQMTKALNLDTIGPLITLGPVGSTKQSGEQTVVGELEWIDLEGGFYSVHGYRLIGDVAVFEPLVGQTVIVIGTLSDEVSIQMVKAIKVRVIEQAGENGVQTIVGLLTWDDLEGGFYSVGGYRLIGDEAAIEPYLDQEVIVTGTFNDEPSIFMTKALNMDTIGPLVTAGKPELPREEQPGPRGKMIGATRKQPVTVIINGQEFTFDFKVNGSTLMVPLRALVKAAGGTIEWSGKDRTAIVTLADRMAYFVASENRAEMNQHNVRYLMRNMIAMECAPTNIAGKLYISADALSSVLGMLEVGEDSDVLNLITAPGVLEPVDPVQEPVKREVISGTIKELKPNGRSRILLQGDAMTSGEAYLIWLSIDDSTKVLRASGEDATVADLVVGQEIKVELAGPVLESYPAQGAAATITIVK